MTISGCKQRSAETLALLTPHDSITLKTDEVLKQAKSPRLPAALPYWGCGQGRIPPAIFLAEHVLRLFLEDKKSPQGCGNEHVTRHLTLSH